MNLLTPKLDIVFKLLFTADTDLLADLINSVLKLPEESRIISVEVKNPGILPDEITKKFIVLDIRATDNNSRHYDIEIQVRKYESYPKRTLYYVSRMYADQLKTGDDYGTLSPVIGIHFLDYELFPGHDDFHFHFYMRDTRYPGLELTDDLSVHIFELPKPDKVRQSAPDSDMTEWIRFFNHAHEEAEKSMRTRYKNPAVHKAFDLLEKISADEETRRKAEIREKALMNEVSMLSAARREGEKTGITIGIEKGEKIGIEKGEKLAGQKTAGQLLSLNILTVQQIAGATGLSTDEVIKLAGGACQAKS